MSSGGKTDFKVIVPTRAGIDLENNDKTIDGHIKIEKYSQQTNIYVCGVVIKPPRSAEGSYRNCHSLYFFFLLNMRMVSLSQTLATPTMGPLGRSCWLLELVSPCAPLDALVA